MVIFIIILNGQDFTALAKYTKEALLLRNKIIIIRKGLWSFLFCYVFKSIFSV